MITLHDIAEISTARLNKRMEVAMKQTENVSKLYTTENKPFDERLVNSCRKQKDDPKAIHEAIFVAHPERLFDRFAYMIFGEIRDAKKLQPDSFDLKQQTIDYLVYCNSIGNYTEFCNLNDSKAIEEIESVLICHGLSPIGDSLLLLADIGRAFRTSKVIEKPLKVMLADPSWMSSNRSIYKFESLNEEQIDKGLRIAFHNREKLYDELKIETDKKGISAYDRVNAISSKKLQKICNYYAGLTSAIWGNSLKHNNDVTESNEVEKINNEIIKVITKPIEQLSNFEGIGGFEVPEHIKSLSQFPGVLRGIETSIKPHLEILRTIAQLFSTFDSEIFSYFFTQYYAQSNYRGKCLKIAPISESKFDKPFDDLDLYFRSWGDGHTTNDLLAEGQRSFSSEKKLAAIYLPQYFLGDFKLLPYTPLSLDALKSKTKDHTKLSESIILIDDTISTSKIESILLKTPLVERNRLLSDLSSFLLLSTSSLGEQCLIDATKELFLPDFYSILSDIHPALKESFKNEVTVFYNNGELKEIWKTWLSKIQEERNPNYTPSHIIFFLLEEEEWNNEYTKKSIINLVCVAIKVYQILVA